MKIAVLSDIHGNVPALQAVLDDVERWRPDQVVVNGDLVSRGPYSLQCVRLLQERVPDCRFLTGNHEIFVLYCADNPPPPEPSHPDLQRFARWTCERLGPDVLAQIRRWDDHIDLDGLDGGASFHITHGSRRGNRDGIHADLDDEALAHKLGDPRDLFVGSHTHRPMVRRLQHTLVVNTGSVGQPFDNDPRSAYGRFTFQNGYWRAEIARVAYDKAQAERDFFESGFIHGGGPLAKIIHLELRQSRMHVGIWMRRYLERLNEGELSVAEGVDEYLRTQAR